jgi:Domain of unknown function (DUF4432)
MAHLFGRDWTREELLRHVGEIEQIARIQPSRLEGGRSGDMRALEVVAGDGLRFTVLPDRCLDIPFFEYRGVSLVWHSRNGLVGPEYYDPHGTEWLRSFFGGLVTTCGLTQVGPPCEDNGEQLGLHGRIANTPAADVRWGYTWQGDECELWIEGSVRETKVFSEDLELIRRISTTLGSRSIRVTNWVRNRGPSRTPLMVLFHVNTGFPVLGPDARLIAADRTVEPRDDRARQGMSDHARFGSPEAGWAEQVYFHDVKPGENGWAHCAVVNESLVTGFGEGLGLKVGWRRDQMWNLNEWKQTGVGDYVVGTEPANCLPEGRCAARESGRLEFIAPGETRGFDLEFAVLAGREEITAFEQTLP